MYSRLGWLGRPLSPPLERFEWLCFKAAAMVAVVYIGKALDLLCPLWTMSL
jgi:hypothetical protein